MDELTLPQWQLIRSAVRKQLGELRGLHMDAEKDMLWELAHGTDAKAASEQEMAEQFAQAITDHEALLRLL